MKKYAYLLAFSILIGGCKFQQPEYLHMLSPAELNQIMQNQDIFLVDVHTPQQQHIKGTDLFIPYDEVEKYQDKLPQDKSTPIYLYCEGGPMGNAAARALHDLGYQKLFNLDGGSKAWRQAGFAFE